MTPEQLADALYEIANMPKQYGEPFLYESQQDILRAAADLIIRQHSSPPVGESMSVIERLDSQRQNAVDALSELFILLGKTPIGDEYANATVVREAYNRILRWRISAIAEDAAVPDPYAAEARAALVPAAAAGEWVLVPREPTNAQLDDLCKLFWPDRVHWKPEHERNMSSSRFADREHMRDFVRALTAAPPGMARLSEEEREAIALAKDLTAAPEDDQDPEGIVPRLLAIIDNHIPGAKT